MIDRRECAECGVQTTEFGCRNCGSTRLQPVAMSPADYGSPDAPLELNEMPFVSRQIAARVWPSSRRTPSGAAPVVAMTCR